MQDKDAIEVANKLIESNNGDYFYCFQCGNQFPNEASIQSVTGNYGLDKDNHKFCLNCCTINEEKQMDENGQFVGYIQEENGYKYFTNWLGTIKIKCTFRHNKHNWWNTPRLDVWFPYKGFIWHGIHLGIHNTICRARRTKKVTQI